MQTADIQTHRTNYLAAVAGLTAADWSAEQIQSLKARLQGQAPAQCVSAARMLVAAKVNGEQAARLLADAWSTPTELRHAITRCRQNPAHQPATKAQAARPSLDAQIAAEEACWADHRAGRGQRPTGEMVQARALQIEMERRAPATATPAPAKLQQARAALAQAEQKARVKGPAEVVVEFLDLEGTLAMVPSSRGVGRYLVRLRDGAAYQCDCEGNAQFNESCWHLRAATVAYAHCDAQRGTVLRAKVLRAREGIRAEAQATLH